MSSSSVSRASHVPILDVWGQNTDLSQHGLGIQAVIRASGLQECLQCSQLFPQPHPMQGFPAFHMDLPELISASKQAMAKHPCPLFWSGRLELQDMSISLPSEDGGLLGEGRGKSCVRSKGEMKK